MAAVSPAPLVVEGQLENTVDYHRWKWIGDDLIRLGALGALPANRKFELMDGEIIEIMPPSPRHAALIGHLSSFLMRLAWASAVHVRPGSLLRLSPQFDLHPDLMVVQGGALDYLERFPAPAETRLRVDFSDSSIGYDRGVKLRAYATAGIPEYWIVNLREEQVEVYREPDGETYRSLRIYKSGEAVKPLAAPEAPVPINVLLGRE